MEELDENFALPELEGKWAWHAAADWPLHAQGWGEGIATWGRLPDAARDVVRPDVWTLSRHSSGLYYEFTTDSPEVAVQWRLLNETLAMPHMPATGVSGLDVYRWTGSGWRMAGAARPEKTRNRTLLCCRARAGGGRLRMYLPLYNGLTELLVGVRPGSALEPHGPQKPPVCVYGTSIVQGGCASRPGMGYTAILGRFLDCPVINLGFSGNGRAEPPMADVLAELDVSAFLIDCLPNLQPDFAEAHLSEFVPRLLRGTGDVPVVFVSWPNFIAGEWENDKAERGGALDGIQRKILARHRAEFPGKIHEISGDGLLGADGEGTVDGIHPTDLGFQRMARGLADPLRRILQPVGTA